MKYRNIKVELAVGTFVLIGFALCFGILGYKTYEKYISGKPWYLKVQLNKGHDIAEGTIVKLNGIEVGTVEDADLTQDNRVICLLAMNPQYRSHVKTTAKAEVIPPAFFGSTEIHIISPPGGSKIEENSMLPVIEISDFMERYGINKDDIQQILNNTNKSLAQLGETLENVNELTKGLAEGRGAMGKLFTETKMYDDLSFTLEKVASIMVKVESKESTMGRLLLDDTLYVQADELLKDLRETLAEVRGQEGQLTQTVERINNLFDEMNKAVAEVRKIAEGVNKGEGTIGKLMTDDAIFKETARILTELRETLEDVREQAPISTFVGALFSAF